MSEHESFMQIDAVSVRQQQAVSRIAGAIAHELNNPLQGILSLLGLTLRECRLDERCQARLEQVHLGVTRLSRTVESLSAIYENLPRTPTLFPINDLLQTLAASLGERGFRVQMQADHGNTSVFALAPEIQRLVSDLLREHIAEGVLLHLSSSVSNGGVELRCENAALMPQIERQEWQALDRLSGVSGLAVLTDEIVTLSLGRVEFKWRDSGLLGIRLWLRSA